MVDSKEERDGPGAVADLPNLSKDPERCPYDTTNRQLCPHGQIDAHGRFAVHQYAVQPYFKEDCKFDEMWNRGKFPISCLRMGTWIERTWKRKAELVPGMEAKRQEKKGKYPNDFTRKFMMSLYWAATGHTVNFEDLEVGNKGRPAVYPMHESGVPQSEGPGAMNMGPFNSASGAGTSKNVGLGKYNPIISAACTPQIDPVAIRCFQNSGYQWYQHAEVENLKAEVAELRHEVERLNDLEQIRHENWELRRQIVEKKFRSQAVEYMSKQHLQFFGRHILQKEKKRFSGYPSVIQLETSNLIITKKECTDLLAVYDLMSPEAKAKLPSGHADVCANCFESFGICPTVSNGSCKCRYHLHCFWMMWGSSGSCQTCFNPPVDSTTFYEYFLRKGILQPSKFYEFDEEVTIRPYRPQPDDSISHREADLKWQEHVHEYIIQFHKFGGINGWMNLSRREGKPATLGYMANRVWEAFCRAWPYKWTRGDGGVHVLCEPLWSNQGMYKKTHDHLGHKNMGPTAWAEFTQEQLWSRAV